MAPSPNPVLGRTLARPERMSDPFEAPKAWQDSNLAQGGGFTRGRRRFQGGVYGK